MNLEAFEEVPNAVEEVNKRVVTGANILGRLVVLYCHKESKRGESTAQTVRRRPIPLKTAAAGGKA
jgi:hypothetical protein